MNTISSSKPLKEDFERRYRKNLEMLKPNAAGLDLHKEEIWVCPGGFQDNYEPEVKTFGTLTGELRKGKAKRKTDDAHTGLDFYR